MSAVMTAYITRDPQLDRSGIVALFADAGINFQMSYVEGFDEPRVDVGSRRFEGMAEIIDNIDYIRQLCVLRDQ